MGERDVTDLLQDPDAVAAVETLVAREYTPQVVREAMHRIASTGARRAHHGRMQHAGRALGYGPLVED